MDVTFKNQHGEEIAGIIDEVEDPIAQAIYAHCFTCSKDHIASYRVCKALAEQNIQVLRFDFSGLGKSQGDFSTTDFSSNISEIKAAVNFLQQNNSPPQLLVGHSLGGIAAAAAACELNEIQAVATIASPSRPAHVLDHFEQHIPTILKEGADEVTVFDQSFKFSKEFIENLKTYDEKHFIKHLNKPILIFHSPFDTIVSIDEAAKIFMEAKHPKSFISLDKTDHLITQKQDAKYIAENIATWAKRYIKK
ncbi:MAG: alpha/beta fold hydrolase [Pseudomonadota bacterium]